MKRTCVFWLLALLGTILIGVLLLPHRLAAVDAAAAASRPLATATPRAQPPRWEPGPHRPPPLSARSLTCGTLDFFPSPVLGVPQTGHGLAGVAALAPDNVWTAGVAYGTSVPQTLIEHWDGRVWEVVPSPSPGVIRNNLAGMAAVNANDIWAVGDYTGSAGTATLVLHWDGRAWAVIPSPNRGTGAAALTGVLARSATDIWAVGWYYDGTTYGTLAEHWDGHSWVLVPVPTPGAGGFLNAIAAGAANDLWAVGAYWNEGTEQVLVEHWNGTAWAVVAAPSAGEDYVLRGVSVAGVDDVWVVGSYYDGITYRALVEHWNGTVWTPISSPEAGHSSRLDALAVLATNDIWAVGTAVEDRWDGETSDNSLVEHWDGRAWTRVLTPDAGPLNTIMVRTPDDMWAVGPTNDPVVAHWNGTAWTVVRTQEASWGQGSLNGVAVLAADNAWAVGGNTVGSPFLADVPLVEHWDGTAWMAVPSPFARGYLHSIAALTANDAWAVGVARDSTNSTDVPLVEHWDGGKWTIVPTPPLQGSLGGVTAVSIADVWAVGIAYNDATSGALIEHWDGHSWTRIANPDPGKLSELQGISAVAADDIWAVGTLLGAPLMEHWNGTAWTVVPTADHGTLHGVTAVATDDVWAVGESDSATLVEHWDGTGWRIVPSPNVLPAPENGNYLSAVAAIGADDVWSVGAYVASGYIVNALVEHWDGRAWSVVPDLVPGTDTSQLGGVAALASQEVWAVGSYFDSPSLPLVERYGGPCSNATPTPTPTVGGVPCPLQFADVQPNDYFYEPVLALACRGAVSGYIDGNFRPYNNTSRGQLTKIIVLAAGWPLDTRGGPHFSDVPPAHPFYPFIETAYHHDIVSGYADGRFRPNADVTRGQLTKIVVAAEGWPLDTGGAAHFTDVPLTHPFYAYIETAYRHGILHGYADGTFRPGNDSTRGQLAIIVYFALPVGTPPATPAAKEALPLAVATPLSPTRLPMPSIARPMPPITRLSAPAVLRAVSSQARQTGASGCGVIRLVQIPGTARSHPRTPGRASS